MSQIDLTGKPHKEDGNYVLPYKHNGYWHDEHGTERLNKQEKELVYK